MLRLPGVGSGGRREVADDRAAGGGGHSHHQVDGPLMPDAPHEVRGQLCLAGARAADERPGGERHGGRGADERGRRADGPGEVRFPALAPTGFAIAYAPAHTDTN